MKPSLLGLSMTLGIALLLLGSLALAKDEQILDAASTGNLAQVKALLAQNPKLVNEKHSVTKWTPFHFAVAGGHADLVEFLLSAGADLKAADTRGATALHFAADPRLDARDRNRATTRRAIAQLLLMKGADVMARDAVGATPLHWAAMLGDGESVKLLVEKGAGVNESASKQGWAPLHGAVGGGHKDIVEYLLQKGANPNLRDGRGKTPLAMATETGRTEIAELLRAHGARE